MGNNTNLVWTSRHSWHPISGRRQVSPSGASATHDLAPQQITGDADPEPSMLDVPMSFNGQGRFAGGTNERGSVLPLMALMLAR